MLSEEGFASGVYSSKFRATDWASLLPLVMLVMRQQRAASENLSGREEIEVHAALLHQAFFFFVWLFAHVHGKNKTLPLPLSFDHTVTVAGGGFHIRIPPPIPPPLQPAAHAT